MQVAGSRARYARVAVAVDDPPAREMDTLLSAGETVTAPLLAMALHELGGPALSLSGAQAGIRMLIERQPSMPDDVIIEVRASGMCGTDLHKYRGPRHAARREIGGHEPAGVVVAATAMALTLPARICEIIAGTSPMNASNRSTSPSSVRCRLASGDSSTG